MRESLERNTGVIVSRSDMVEVFAAYDALTAERDRLRAALEEVRGCGQTHFTFHSCMCSHTLDTVLATPTT